jgi:hypothetical protein
MPLRNRAQFRDSIRRMLNQVPPADSGTGAPGDEPPQNAWPNNFQVNQAIDQAVDFLVQETEFATALSVAIPVPVWTAAGPQTFSLETAGITAGILAGDLTEIRRLYFVDAGGNSQLLIPRSFYEMDRDGRNWQIDPAGAPRFYFAEGYTLYLLPGSNQGGTLYLMAGSGLLGFVLDTDIINGLPELYQSTIDYQAVCFLCASRPQSAEAMALLKAWQPFATEGIAKIREWDEQRVVLTEQQRIGVKTNRQLVGHP